MVGKRGGLAPTILKQCATRQYLPTSWIVNPFKTSYFNKRYNSLFQWPGILHKHHLQVTVWKTTSYITTKQIGTSKASQPFLHHVVSFASSKVRVSSFRPIFACTQLSGMSAWSAHVPEYITSGFHLWF